MGKGGGCVPSKAKPRRVAAPDHGAPAPPPPPPPSDPITVPVETLISPIENAPSPKLRLFIVFYSMYGHVETLARQIKKGVDSIDGVEGVLYRVPETLSKGKLEQMKAGIKDEAIPVVSVEELTEADGFLFGFPARYGTMAAQMKAFFDSTGGLWREQRLAGVPAGLFVGTGTQGGGQETTAWTAITQLAHHGMVYVPIGYTFGDGMYNLDSVRGGSPYGAGFISGDGTREPDQGELDLAQHQGKYMATIVKRLFTPSTNK